MSETTKHAGAFHLYPNLIKAETDRAVSIILPCWFSTVFLYFRTSHFLYFTLSGSILYFLYYYTLLYIRFSSLIVQI